MDAGRGALADIALNHFIMDAVNQRASEWAGGHTGFAFDALVLVDIHRAGFRVASDAVEQTGFGAGGIIALKTDNGDKLIGSIGERVNARFARLFHIAVAERAGEFAGAAPGAFIGDNLESESHSATSFAFLTILPIWLAVAWRLQSSQVSK